MNVISFKTKFGWISISEKQGKNRPSDIVPPDELILGIWRNKFHGGGQISWWPLFSGPPVPPPGGTPLTAKLVCFFQDLL